jgi:parvulin-like peptidyl-prolyl isomerase
MCSPPPQLGIFPAVNSLFFTHLRPFLGIAIALVAGVSAFGVSGCQKSGEQPVVLAQVEDATLTLGELREAFPAEYEKILPREQYLDVIQRWIDDEAVYQQALKQKLHEEPQVKRKLERLQRRMIIEEFLAREVGATSESEPDEGAMTRYYENNRADFLRKAPEYRYLHIRVETLKEALAVRSKVRGDNFATLLRKNSLDSAEAYLDPPFRKTTEVPACLHDVLDARPGWLSGPISCPDGVYLIRLLERIEAGTPMPFPEVRASIAARLSMQHKEKMRESKIRQYKEGVTINLNIDQIPGQDGTEAPAMNGYSDSNDTGDEERLPPGE